MCVCAQVTHKLQQDRTVSPREHLFYVDFLFFICTSHRGGNVSTAVRTFPPQ